MDPQIKNALNIPVGISTPVMTFAPVVLSAPGRAVDLEMRVAVPATGRVLPLILLSHGHGDSNFLSSRYGYSPLVDFYAAHGFVVIQPTHLSSKSLRNDPRVDANGPEGPLFWRSRAEDMRRILDGLDEIEAAVPELTGRIDRGRVAVVGHSLGGHTASLLLGMRLTDPSDGIVADLADGRISAGVLLATPGGSAGANGAMIEKVPILGTTDFTTMRAPALVVAGDQDINEMFSDKADWRSDAYRLSPGPKSLFTVFGGEHILGGISGYDAGETSDESPERVKIVQRVTWAYLRSALNLDDDAWSAAQAALATEGSSGRIESK